MREASGWGGVRLRKLAAQKLQIDSGARPSIRPVPGEARQKNKQMKYLGILHRGKSHSLAFLFLIVLNEICHGRVERSRRLHRGRLFIINP